jgi:Ca2+-binding RTX toxin-like protein
MDLNDVEAIHFNALGGADAITLNDLSGTDLNQVRLDLSTPIGSGIGDGQPDAIVVNGTSGAEQLTVSGSAAELVVAGGQATVSITGHEGVVDTLTVQARGGSDTVSASGLAGGLMSLILDGGEASDVLIGSRGADLLIGGEGDDTVIWNPGDGSDLVEGRGGRDILQFNGSAVGETVDLSANGSRLRFFRDVANIVMDCDDLEEVQFRALGGADRVQVNSLAGTDVSQVTLDLSATANSGLGDGQPDTVVVAGTQGDDVVTIQSTVNEVQVLGLSAAVRLIGAEGAQDQLALNAQGGADVVNASALPAGRIGLVTNGGLGDDIVFGSAGDDLFAGGDGDDTVFGGAGNDTVVWNPGDDNDVVEGQDGFDTLLFNGANVSENIDIAANGGRVRFFRNIANVAMT